jgi:nitroreductase
MNFTAGRINWVVALAVGMSFLTPVIKAYGADAAAIELPKPQKQGGKPLMQALNERRSRRAFSAKELPLQVLSDLLWAANGVNRPETGGLTAPSTRGLQEIDIYVAKADGLFLYEPRGQLLIPISDKDIRILTGTQPFVKDAPVNLIFVADTDKMKGMTDQEKDFYAATDTGFISENVYLYCASEGLATVVRGSVQKLSLKKAMKLRDAQTIILAQTVGYPE